MSKHSLWDEELKNVIFNRWRINILKSPSKIISFNTLYALIYHVLLVYHSWWVWWISTVRLLDNKPGQILKSIVIVDDEEDLCNLFTEVLQNNGYNVLGFLDPIQALVRIQANPNQYCLLISDFRMNKLNGCELGMKVQELNNNIQVIIISACENIEGNFRNFELLHKPISIPNLIAKVRSYVKWNTRCINPCTTLYFRLDC